MKVLVTGSAGKLAWPLEKLKSANVLEGHGDIVPIPTTDVTAKVRSNI